MTIPLMLICGHAANGHLTNGAPACAICGCATISTEPDLTARTARCGQCGKERQSSRALPFFEYRGPGSDAAERQCVCGYYDTVHTLSPVPAHLVAAMSRCHGFKPAGDRPDGFYCGCRGWD